MKKVINKHKSLFIGAVLGIFTVWIISELFQALVGYILGSDVYINFDGIFISAQVFSISNLNNFQAVLFNLSPFIIVILLVEINFYFLRSFELGTKRNISIVFQIIIFGYIIVKVILFRIINDTQSRSLKRYSKSCKIL